MCIGGLTRGKVHDTVIHQSGKVKRIEEERIEEERIEERNILCWLVSIKGSLT